MKKKRYLLLVLMIFYTGVTSSQQKSEIPVPTQAQLEWQNAELVTVFHYDLHVFDGEPYIQRENRVTPIPDHNIFNPKKLDTDQWIKAAKAMGAKIAILTATHETGFALYQSDVNPYCLKAVNWRNGEGDVVREFVNSCRKYNIQPGIYIGIRWNSYYGIHDFKVHGDGKFAQNRQKHYNNMCEGMVREICSRYGDLAIVWFDGGAYGPEQGGPNVLPIFEKYQPNGLFYHNLQRADIRWGGSESGTVPYPCWGTFPYQAIGAGESAPRAVSANNFALLKTGDPKGDYYMPAMSDAPLRGHGAHQWFWERGGEKYLYPLEDLMNMYYNSVGHNSTLILGITPNPEGLIPKPDVRRMKAFGEEIKQRFSDPVAAASGSGNELTIELNEKKEIDHVVISEDILKGERVREFVVEGKNSGGWKKLSSGSCIGHKYIDHFDGEEVSKVRLVIKESLAEPVVKKFAVY